jgi:hypothetical protein
MGEPTGASLDTPQEGQPTMDDERPDIVWLPEPIAQVAASARWSLSVGEMMGAVALLAIGLGLARVHPILGILWAITGAPASVRAHGLVRRRGLGRWERLDVFLDSFCLAMLLMPVSAFPVGVFWFLGAMLGTELGQAIRPDLDVLDGLEYGGTAGAAVGAVVAFRMLVRRSFSQ